MSDIEKSRDFEGYQVSLFTMPLRSVGTVNHRGVVHYYGTRVGIVDKDGFFYSEKYGHSERGSAVGKVVFPV